MKKSKSKFSKYLSKYPDGGKIKYEAPVVNFGQVSDNLNSTLPNSSKVDKIINLDVQTNLINKQNKIGEINEAQPDRSTIKRVWDIASHPATAASAALNHQDLPEHFTRGNQNILDNAIDIVNPVAWLDNVKKVPFDIKKGNYGSAVMNSLYGIPLAQSIKGIPKISKIGNTILESKLSNNILDRINPNASNEINKGINWLDDYYNNPSTLKKYNKLQDYSLDKANKIYPENTIKVSTNYGDIRILGDEYPAINLVKGANKKSLSHYKENLNNPQIKLTTDNKILGNDNLSVKGIHRTNTGETFVNKIAKNKSSVTVHEGTHQMFGRNYTEKEIEMLRKPFRNSKDKYEGYLTKPQEIHARMNEIRYNLGLKAEDKFTPDMISKVKTNTPGIKKLLNMIQDKNEFSKLMNDFYTISGVTTGTKLVLNKNNNE